MRNPAGLRSFPSPHPSLFSKFLVQFLGSNEKRMEARAYIGWETRGGGPVAPGGGRQTPSPRPGTSLQIQKKFTLRSCRPPTGDRGYFRKFSKRTYIFEFFIFLNIKKEKDASTMGLAPMGLLCHHFCPGSFPRP